MKELRIYLTRSDLDKISEDDDLHIILEDHTCLIIGLDQGIY